MTGVARHSCFSLELLTLLLDLEGNRNDKRSVRLNLLFYFLFVCFFVCFFVLHEVVFLVLP